MKFFKLLLVEVIILGFVVFAACDRNRPEDKTLIQERTEFLVNKGIWTANVVSVPGNSSTESSDWEDTFTVRFTETNMTASNHPSGAEPVWPSGQWGFKDENADVIVRGDGIEMSVITLTATALMVSFDYNPGGRVSAIEGPYTFDMD